MTAQYDFGDSRQIQHLHASAHIDWALSAFTLAADLVLHLSSLLILPQVKFNHPVPSSETSIRDHKTFHVSKTS
jgi:hypothetical protein